MINVPELNTTNSTFLKDDCFKEGLRVADSLFSLCFCYVLICTSPISTWPSISVRTVQGGLVETQYILFYHNFLFNYLESQEKALNGPGSEIRTPNPYLSIGWTHCLGNFWSYQLKSTRQSSSYTKWITSNKRSIGSQLNHQTTKEIEISRRERGLPHL